jgi:hypothetical protein
MVRGDYMTEHNDEKTRYAELPTEAKIRVAGRGLVMAYGAYGNHQSVLEQGPEIALISAGIDPDAVNTESADYKVGAAEAFAAITNSMLEMKPADDTQS